jgi:regulator of replication initiation timing
MQELLKHIENIEQKIQHLGKKMSSHEKEKALLIEENIKLKKDLEQLRNSQKDLGLQIDRMRNGEAKPGASTFQQTELRKELDFYIKEVDKCIQLMENIS